MKVAIVHDHLTQFGGAEQVLKVIQRAFPDAPTFTLFYDEEKMKPFFGTTDIRTSFLQKIPGAVRHYQWFLSLMPTATESYDLSEYDVVISCTSAFAKGVITNSSALHLCYCHTPTRYLWSDTHRYVEELKYNSLIKKIVPRVLTKLRQWDQLAAQRPDVMIANSKFVAQRIEKYYRRDSVVLHPPVSTKQFTPSEAVEDYFVTGGRLVAYKRFDIAIKAFNRLGIKLKVFGTGPEMERLQKLAKDNIEFLGWVTDEQKNELYSKARAFVNPQVEDFGITVIESMAAGRPVIAYNCGGVCETVVSGKTGTFFDEQTWESLADTVVRFDYKKFDSQAIRQYAEQFSEQRFIDRLQSTVKNNWEQKQSQQIRCGF